MRVVNYTHIRIHIRTHNTHTIDAIYMQWHTVIQSYSIQTHFHIQTHIHTQTNLRVVVGKVVLSLSENITASDQYQLE